MNYLQSAQALYEQMVRDRRHLHQHPEVGMDLPETCSYVMARLTEMGYQPRRLGGGVTATLTGKPDGKVFLLRADMDALPMREESGLPFASQRSCAHTCGHDMHTAMLLGAAQLLRDRAAELNGTVKFMFQPGEEVLSGARSMIEAGILEDPHVDAAMGAHMIPMIPAGLGGYGTGVVSASSDHLVIRVEGRGGHGAHPQSTVDPINIGVHIHLALQELLSREADPAELVVLTFGKFQGGDAANIIPSSTGAAKAIGLVLPELNGKLIGAAQRVPTPTGSITNLYCVVDKKVTVDEVNAAMKAYAETIPETFAYNEDDIVSSDIIGETHGSIFDATQTMVQDLGNGQSLVQVTSWYDNENSYTSQMVRTIKYFEKFVA